MPERFATSFALLASLFLGGAASAQTGTATPPSQAPATSVSDPSGTAGTVAPPIPQPQAGAAGSSVSGSSSTNTTTAPGQAGQAPGAASAPRQ